MLEPRQLLSAVSWLPGTAGWLRLEFPEALAAGCAQSAGQVIYLDFDGAEDVTYNGLLTVAGIDVPAFSAAGLDAPVAFGAPQEAAAPKASSPQAAGCESDFAAVLVETITSQVARLLAPFCVEVTNQVPQADAYSTIYIGGAGWEFAAWGDFLGLAEAVDAGNLNPRDKAFVFSENLRAPGIAPLEYALAVALVAAHEAGHLLGMAHPRAPAAAQQDAGLVAAEQVAARTNGPLDAVAHKMEPGMEVHQWLALQAYDLYLSQFDFGNAFGGFGELGSYLAAPGLDPGSPWADLAAATHNYDGDNNILEGTADEDTTDNPFGQSFPYFRHFVHGGDGAEMYQGLDDWWIPGSDPGQGGSYYSNLEQAQFYWYGWESAGHQPGLVELYAAGAKDTAYWYLGHVAHLIADMTVPAHVHGDAHGGPLFGGDDAYEDWVGAASHFQLAPWTTTAPGWQIELPASLEAWFELTADYTEDYDSDDYDGWDAPGENGPEYSASFRSANRHRPQEVENNGELTDAECQLVAADLLPWAIEQIAALYRLFYRAADTSGPVVSVPGFSLDVDQPTLLTTPVFPVSATGSDPQSGVGRNLFQFYTAAWTGAEWGPWQPHGQGPAADLLGPFGEGLYALTASATNGGGQIGYAPVGYFLVDLNEPPVAEAGGPYETLEGTPVLLDASASFDPDGMIVAYTWDLDGDGQFDDAVGPTTLFAARDGTYTVHVQVLDNQGAAATDSATITVQHMPAQVTGRYVFYNNSAFDDPGQGRSDADAIAADKVALLPGQHASFANYTSYEKGLNGIFIDIQRLDGLPQLDDFEFRLGGVGRFDPGPQSWTLVPPEPQISVAWAETLAEPDRIALIWPDGAIRNQWLMVRIKATATTGLAEPSVFLFGNAVGESGNSATNTYVDGSDFAAARDHFTSAAALDNPYDFNRDGRVDAADMELARSGATNLATCLALVDLSAWPPGALLATSVASEELLAPAGDLSLAPAGSFADTSAPPAGLCANGFAAGPANEPIWLWLELFGSPGASGPGLKKDGDLRRARLKGQAVDALLAAMAEQWPGPVLRLGSSAAG